jgi:hypothetical protein
LCAIGRKRFARNFAANGGKICVNFLKDENTMDTAGTATHRDPDKPRDHLDVFREFIDHLERSARMAAQDKRRRVNAR